jgi:hypothetical protein
MGSEFHFVVNNMLYIIQLCNLHMQQAKEEVAVVTGSSSGVDMRLPLCWQEMDFILMQQCVM